MPELTMKEKMQGKLNDIHDTPGLLNFTVDQPFNGHTMVVTIYHKPGETVSKKRVAYIAGYDGEVYDYEEEG